MDGENPFGSGKESYYLSEAVGSGVSILKDPKKLGEEFYIDILAKTIKKIHNAGLFHKDLHAGNLLWDGESFFLTDLHRARIVGSLSLSQRLWNLSQLFHSLKFIFGEKDQSKFMEVYFERDPFYLQKKAELLQKISSLMNRLQKRHWQSRTKRCLKESNEFSIQKERGINFYHRRDLPLDRLKKVIKEHLYLVKERPLALVKNSSEIVVSILNVSGQKVCVKQFRNPYFFDRFKEHFRRSKGLKAWVAGNGLRARGIPSIKPLAFVEKWNWMGLRESFFLMEVPEKDQELDRYILKGFRDFKEKRQFIKTFAQWLSLLNQMDLYHQDMKACNLMVSEDGETWDFHFLDLEDVELSEKVHEAKVFKNFLQLNTSTPKIISRTDRIRFVKEYLFFRPVIKNYKSFLKRLIDESQRRGFVYVSPHGVVIEKMD